MKVGRTLRVTTPHAWRAWLRAHHRSAREIWLVYHRKETGRKRISYNDAVDQALCFGWIDSTVKSLRGGAFAQRFTPRRKNAPISEMNKARVRRLLSARQMTKAGLEALPGHRAWLRPGPVKLRADVRRALRREPETWRHFQQFPASYQRIRIAFIEGARSRPDVFRKRLAFFVKKTRLNERFGMVQS